MGAIYAGAVTPDPPSSGVARVGFEFAPDGHHEHSHVVGLGVGEAPHLFEELTNRTFANAPQPKDGFIEIPDAPGLGLTLDEDHIR